jgi:ABC-type transporter Mla subunit MlaD
MSSRAERNRNNVVAGTFVLVAVGLGVGVFIALQKINFRPRTPYAITFAVKDGVAGLARGSAVRVGGLLLGEVTQIEPVEPADGKPVERIRVLFELDSDIPLYDNAEAFRAAPLLGDSSWINFTTIGGPGMPGPDGQVDQEAKLLPAGSELVGMATPGLLANIVGPDNALRLEKVVENVEEVSDSLRVDYRESIHPALNDAATVVRNFREDYTNWRGRVETALASAEQAAENLEKATADASALVTDAQATLTAARPDITATLTNVRDASASAREIVVRAESSSIPKLEKVLDDAEAGLASIADLVGRVDVEFQDRMPAIAAGLNDLRTTAQQLKLATIEIRRSPWRLLYTPPKDVYENEQLFEAARSFAIASGDLRVAAEGLERLSVNPPDILAADPALQERIRKELGDALVRYAEAQRRLYGVLTGGERPAPSDGAAHGTGDAAGR